MLYEVITNFWDCSGKQILNGSSLGLNRRMKKAGIEYHIYIYEGAGHGFNNDTGAGYHEEAAKLVV